MYSENTEYLTQTIKNDRIIWNLLKTKPFTIKLNLTPHNLLQTHKLLIQLVSDLPERNYPIISQETQKILESTYTETSNGIANVKASIHLVSRANQSVPFRIAITTVPIENLPIEQQIHFKMLSDPISVISRLKTKTVKNNSTTVSTTQPSSIANSIQKIMEMLESQNKLLQTVSNKIVNQPHENPKIDHFSENALEPYHKKNVSILLMKIY